MKFLFVVNPGSGNYRADWLSTLNDYFSRLDHEYSTLVAGPGFSLDLIKKKLEDYKPQRVVAVGGDGTVNLVAQCLLFTDMCLGIWPTGSANGLATELLIPNSAMVALDIIVKGQAKKIHVVEINENICLHLSDIGFNAWMMEEFEVGHNRGKSGYLMAFLKVLRLKPRMKVILRSNLVDYPVSAAMIVLANASKYATGARINPIGKLDDEFFEVVIVKRLSYLEIFKMIFSHKAFDPVKTQVMQVTAVTIHSKRKVHFQIDGEYKGKINTINASILPAALHIIVPGTSI